MASPPRPPAEPPLLPHAVEATEPEPRGALLGDCGEVAVRTPSTRTTTTCLEERMEQWMRSCDAKLDALTDVCSAFASISSPGGSESHGGAVRKRGSLIRTSVRKYGSSLLPKGRVPTHSESASRRSTGEGLFSDVLPSGASDCPGRSPTQSEGDPAGWVPQGRLPGVGASTEADPKCDAERESIPVPTRRDSGLSRKSEDRLRALQEVRLRVSSASSSAVLPAFACRAGAGSDDDAHGEHVREKAYKKGASMVSVDTRGTRRSSSDHSRCDRTSDKTTIRGNSPKKDEQLERKLKMRSESLRLDEFHHGKSLLANVVNHRYFDVCITAVVCLNALIIGAQTEFVARNGEDEPGFKFFHYAESICTLVFVCELAARVAVNGRHFLTNAVERYWNVFDSFLVGVALLDFVISMAFTEEDGGLPSSGAFMGKLLRALRLTRVMRILRTVRFVSELRVMVHMIVNSLLSLFWVLVILVALIYTFSIILTSGAIEYLQPQNGVIPSDSEKVKIYFGSLFDTMYTLYKAIAGGLDWGEVSDLLRGPGWVYEAIIICYTLFTTFAVVNIVTGVFVDGAIELAKRDRTLLIHKHAKDQFAHEGHLIGLLQAIDTNGDDKISAEDFSDAMQRADVKEFLSAMHVEIPDVGAFFDMLDQNSDGEVDILEFVTGMQKLRGEAKSVDIHMMMHQNMKTLQMVTGLVDALCAGRYETGNGDGPASNGSDVCSVGSDNAARVDRNLEA